MKKNRLHLAGRTLLAPVSWGTTYVTVTELLPADRPLFVALSRVVPAGLLLAAIGFVRSGWRPVGAQWWRTTTLAVFNFGLFFPLLIIAVYRLPGGVAASFGGLQPLLVVAIGHTLGWQGARARDVAVGIAAALGVALVVIRPGAAVDLVGVAAAIGANLSFAAGVVVTKRFEPPTDRVAAAGWQLMVGAVVIAPVALLVEGAPPQLSATNLAGFAYLSLVATGVAFVLWFDGIAKLPAVAPPLLGLAAPVTGAALGWAIKGEDLSATQLAGFVITIGAITYGAVTRGAPAATDGDSATRSQPARSQPARAQPGNGEQIRDVSARVGA